MESECNVSQWIYNFYAQYVIDCIAKKKTVK